MTIGYSGFMGGESRDSRVDGNVANTSVPAGWSIISAPVRTGVGAWQCIVNGSQGGSLGSTWPSTNLAGRVAGINLSAAPSAAFALDGEDADNRLAIECGTDRKLRLVQLGSGGSRWSGRTPITDWSPDALAVGSYSHYALLADAITLGASHIWVSLIIDGVVQWSVDGGAIGYGPFSVCPPIGSVNAGTNVRVDDWAGLGSIVAGDAPHLVNWPKPIVSRQLAISDDVAQWTKGGGGAGSYTEWDETGGGDDDTTYNTTNTTSKKQTSGGQNAASIGITGHTVLHQTAAPTRGPCINLIHRTVSGGSKWNGNAVNSLGGLVPLTMTDPGTTYIGERLIFTKSGGWVVGDLASLNFGVQTGGNDHDKAWRVTLCMMQWLTYASTLPKTTRPTLGARPQVLIV